MFHLFTSFIVFLSVQSSFSQALPPISDDARKAPPIVPWGPCGEDGATGKAAKYIKQRYTVDNSDIDSIRQKHSDLGQEVLVLPTQHLIKDLRAARFSLDQNTYKVLASFEKISTTYDDVSPSSSNRLSISSYKMVAELLINKSNCTVIEESYMDIPVSNI